MNPDKKEKNVSAFPALHLNGHEGMSLRDYFAAKAMQGMITKYGKPDDYNWQYGIEDTHDVLSRKCYKIADTMLKQRDL